MPMLIGPFITTNTNPLLGRSIVLTSIWIMKDMKATLLLHAYVNRSIHHHQSTIPMLGRTIVFRSIWRMDDMKATLWCHAHVKLKTIPGRHLR